MPRRLCLACMVLAAALEPICHALGIPHPEGLPQLFANFTATTHTEG